MRNVMKFSPELITILKNFTSINPSIHFKTGNVVSTISPGKNILARTTVETPFEESFAIYDLPRFLSTLSLFKEPELTLKSGQYVEIRQGDKVIKYQFASPDLILSPPNKEISLKDCEVEFDLSVTQFSELMRAQSVLGSPNVVVSGDGENMYLKTMWVNNNSGDAYSLKIGETSDTFTMIFNSDNLKLIPMDYHVKIHSKGFSQFSGTNLDYFIAVEAKSTFGK
jgi:hypothetical protein